MSDEPAHNPATPAPDCPEPPQSHLPSATTAEEDLTTRGQRKINFVWEATQSLIALSVVGSAMAVGIYQGVMAAGGVHTEYPAVLSSAMFLVVGFYFSRTNHTATGGVGRKPSEGKYTGR